MITHPDNFKGMKIIYPYGNFGTAIRDDIGTGTTYYVSHRWANIHKCHKYNGYGISIDILDDLKARGIEYIYIVLFDIKTMLICTVSDFSLFCKVDNLGGYEDQGFLDENMFDSIVYG